MEANEFFNATHISIWVALIQINYVFTIKIANLIIQNLNLISKKILNNLKLERTKICNFT